MKNKSVISKLVFFSGLAAALFMLDDDQPVELANYCEMVQIWNADPSGPHEKSGHPDYKNIFHNECRNG